MPTTPRQWDEKYRAGAEGPAQEPTTILRELLPLLPKGPALDLACGTGRNALFLMYRQPVTAVDRSESALEVIEHRARKAGIGVCRGTQIDAARAGVCVISADLETATLPSEQFALIVCTRYLERRLFREMVAALKPGGALLFETYTMAQMDFAGGPKDPLYLLERGELRMAFPELKTVFYRELSAGQGMASLLAIKPPLMSASS
jgi:SAM-dependent methyltransferase